MGTRSITIFKDSDVKHTELCVLYRQRDGYPEGHGEELANFLMGFVIVNGISTTEGKIANDGSCLAAQAIAHFKDGVGQFYLMRAGTRNVCEEFTYIVTPTVGEEIRLKVKAGHKVIFDDVVSHWNLT